MSPEELGALLDAPALKPPPGVTPTFENPPNRNGYSWGITTVCMVVATICLCMRWYVRIWMDRKIRVEDVMAICAYGAYWGTTYAAYALIYAPGYYVHTWNLQNREMIRPLYLILVYGCCYSTVLPLIKTAILLDWCRVFVTVDRASDLFWKSCMVIVCFQCIWGILCIILLNLQCRPHQAIWEFYLPSKCYSLPKVMLCSASVQVFIDLSMFMLPQKMIWCLHMSHKKRLGISIIFGAGILALVSACFRLAHTVSFASQADTIYLIGPLLFWADAEMTCGFFIFSVPCLSKLVMRSGIRNKIFSILGISNPSSTWFSHSPGHMPRAHGPRHTPKPTTDTSWSRIDEEHDVELGSQSESQTNLHKNPSTGTQGIHVKHTMDVTVSST